MSWIVMSLRRSELQKSISDHTYEKLKISRQLRQLSNFSSAIADGHITPNEISSLGFEEFGDGMDFMQASNQAAQEKATEMADYYCQTYDGITQEQYYNNSAIASQAQLYFDENGQLDYEAIYNNFYEKALEEFAEQYIAPQLNEYEQDLQQKQTELETLVESEEAELEQLKQSVSQEISNNTIKLS